jgi:ATP-dependent exoDNAse (exonuclease V) beta subunit
LHKPEAGEHTVVWWDPSVLDLNREDEIGARLNKLLTADEPGQRSQRGLRDHAEWQAERSRVRENASIPSLRVITATELASKADQQAESEGGQRGVAEEGKQPQSEKTIEVNSGQLDLFAATASPQTPPVPRPGPAPDVAIESVGIDFSRPHGKRFGTLVHAVLSIVDLNADEANVQQIANLQGRILGATLSEIGAANETVNRSLAHPLMRRASKAMRAGRCRREAPISMQLEDGTILEGNVDLAFLEEGEHERWTVVDFKTDFEIAGRLEEYCKQVALYARAISLATSKEANGVLLRM